MDQKFYHGNLNHSQVARSLAAQFNRGNLSVRVYSEPLRSVVQIATNARPSSGGRTAMNIILTQMEDGVGVQIGQQDFMGVAASLGVSALAVFNNPLNILGRLDDIAQDIEYLRLSEEVYRTVEAAAQTANATTQLSDRLRTLPCLYCNTANPPGEPHCIACGAPLGDNQPQTCRRCGFVVRKNETICPNCKSTLT
jgi:hypothetical protein